MIPGNADHLSSLLQGGYFPSGSTPTYPALVGTSQFATNIKDMFPEDNVIIVLVTDGVPNSCDVQDISSLASVASSAYNYNGVRTYVVAIAGISIADFNQVAHSGGTHEVIDIIDDITLLDEKLIEIRDSASENF